MFRRFWASNWPKVLFAQIVAIVFVIGAFLVLTYGFQVVNHTKSLVCTGILCATIFLVVLIVCVTKVFPVTLFFLLAIGMSWFSAIVAFELEPLLFSETPTFTTIALLVSLAIIFVPRLPFFLIEYGLPERWVKFSYMAQFVISICLFILL